MSVLTLCSRDDVLLWPTMAGRRSPRTPDPYADEFVERLILAFSAFVERYCDRLLFRAAYTETLDIDDYQDTLSVRAYPIDTTQPITLKQSFSGDFTHTTAMGSDQYAALSGGLSGLIRFRLASLLGGTQSLQVAYTGGIGTEVDDVPADLRMAVSQQVAFQVARAPSMHMAAQHLQSSSATYANRNYADLALLPEVKIVLNEYMRPAF